MARPRTTAGVSRRSNGCFYYADCGYGISNSLGPVLVTTEEKIAAQIESIHALMRRPLSQPVTSVQMEARADRMKNIATTVKINGGRVRKEYE
jgi:hypothetical protein